MPGPVVTTPLGLQDVAGHRAVAVVSPNTRVRGQLGFVATVADQLLFAGPPSVSGRWLVGNTRTFVGGVATISASAAGITVSAAPPSTVGPILIVQPDGRIRST
jgi:hypothetical protein